MWVIAGVIVFLLIILKNSGDDDNDNGHESSWLVWILIGFLLDRSKRNSRSEDEYLD
jgi:hypothetical protein